MSSAALAYAPFSPQAAPLPWRRIAEALQSVIGSAAMAGLFWVIVSAPGLLE